MDKQIDVEEGRPLRGESGSDGLTISAAKRGLFLLTFQKWLMSRVFIDDPGYEVWEVEMKG